MEDSSQNKAFSFFSGNTPLLVSMPHSGLQLTEEVENCLTDKAKGLPDTDWYIPELYSFLGEMEVACISANYSRYVIDLNRPLDDKPLYQSKTTGLFPGILFDESPVFKKEQKPSDQHRIWCKENIWEPYHRKIRSELERIKSEFGYAILFDAHSIAAEVPMLFEGKLIDFNFGNNNGNSCASNLIESISEVVGSSAYSQITNGRFKGGYITRSFGQPEKGLHAIQLELSQATYLKDQTENGYHLDSEKLNTIKLLLNTLINSLINNEPN